MALPSYFSDVWKKTVQAKSQPHDDYKCKKQEKENGLKAMFPVWCPDGLVETSVSEMVTQYEDVRLRHAAIAMRFPNYLGDTVRKYERNDIMRDIDKVCHV